MNGRVDFEGSRLQSKAVESNRGGEKGGRNKLRPSRRERSGERGFTLLELVVVLGILAVVSVVAVKNVARRQNGLRGERSDRVLEELRRGICGDLRMDEDEGVRGFVEDMGRLPRAVAWTNEAGEVWVGLGELVEKPAGVPEFQTVTVNAGVLCANSAGWEPGVDDKAKVSFGWAGPYAMPSVGAKAPWFRDGWGNAFVAREGGGNANRISSETNFVDAGAGMTVAFLRHLGADGEVEGSEWARGGEDDGDAVVDLRWATNAVAHCRASFSNATEVVFRLYLPCDCEGGGARIHVREMTDRLEGSVLEGENGFGAAFTGCRGDGGCLRRIRRGRRGG